MQQAISQVSAGRAASAIGAANQPHATINTPNSDRNRVRILCRFSSICAYGYKDSAEINFIPDFTFVNSDKKVAQAFSLGWLRSIQVYF